MDQLLLGLLITLILGSYGFTAGGYLYIYRVERRVTNLITNHVRHELDAIIDRLDKLEGGE